MSTDGIEAVFLETRNWGKAAKFFQARRRPRRTVRQLNRINRNPAVEPGLVQHLQ